MALSRKLEIEIDRALKGLAEHPNSDLNLGYRHAIWSTLGPRKVSRPRSNNPGLQRRAKMAIASAARALPYWENTWPKDNTPRLLIGEAEQVLLGNVDEPIAEKDFGVYWTHLDGVAFNTDDPSVMAGYSAAKALFTAIFDEVFDPDNIDYALVDSDVDPYDSDASFAAATAYAGGTVWDSKSSSTKREEFWKWWLLEAVPASWPQ